MVGANKDKLEQLIQKFSKVNTAANSNSKDPKETAANSTSKDPKETAAAPVEAEEPKENVQEQDKSAQ